MDSDVMYTQRCSSALSYSRARSCKSRDLHTPSGIDSCTTCVNGTRCVLAKLSICGGLDRYSVALHSSMMLLELGGADLGGVA
jgi:hypothetical protein